MHEGHGRSSASHAFVIQRSIDMIGHGVMLQACGLPQRNTFIIWARVDTSSDDSGSSITFNRAICDGPRDRDPLGRAALFVSPAAASQCGYRAE